MNNMKIEIERCENGWILKSSGWKQTFNGVEVLLNTMVFQDKKELCNYLIGTLIIKLSKNKNE